MTYALINVPFLLVAVLVLVVAFRLAARPALRPWLIACLLYTSPSPRD